VELVVGHRGAAAAQGGGDAFGRAEDQVALACGAGSVDHVGLGLGQPGEQRDLPGQGQTVREALDDRLSRREVGGDPVELGEEGVELAQQYRLEEHLLVRVGAIQRAAADARGPGDVLDVGAAGAVLLEDLLGCIEDLDAHGCSLSSRTGTPSRGFGSAVRSRGQT
jgi:hypothetical protein